MPAINELLKQGRYRIIQQFGQNGSGTIYEAHDANLNVNVLLKENLVKLNKVTTAAQREASNLAFASEAKMMTEIAHETLLPVRDYFSEIDRHYLVMEAIEGNNLSELLEKNQSPFPLAEVTGWAENLLEALHYLHTHTPPIIHREIRPQNLTLTPNGKVKLLPFGIVKTPDAGMPARKQTIDSVTLNYLPLEQIWDGLDPASQKVITNSYDEKSEKILEMPLDARSDVYALGATLYHLATARMPIDALERSIEILEGKPDPLLTPNQVDPSIPLEISDVLMRALEIKRENRYSSAVIMRQVLRTAFVRVKEREAATATKKQADISAQEIQAAEQNRAEQERRRAEQEKLKAEAEQKRQADLVKQQLREVEAQKLLAEQRAAEAEKRLLEKESAAAAAAIIEKPLAAAATATTAANAANAANAPASSVSVTPPAILPAAANAPQIVAEQTPAAYEPKELFADIQSGNKTWWRMPAAALLVLALAGAGVGGWFFLNSQASQSSAITPSQTISSIDTAKPETPVETAPAPTAEPIPEMTATPDAAGETIAAEVPNNLPAKVKPVAPPAPQPKAKKPVSPAPNAAAEQKKPVTVDDIINDN